jgi:hypothetical protein
MPTWANNPDYTMHATSTKPEVQHKTVIGIFDNNNNTNVRNSKNQDIVNKERNSQIEKIDEENSRRSSSASFTNSKSKRSNSVELKDMSANESSGKPKIKDMGETITARF